MSKFTDSLKVEIIDNGKGFKLLRGIEYYREHNKAERLIVPKDFITDLASVPRLFWSIYPPQGAGKKQDYSAPAVLHDYLYDKTCIYVVSRKEADDIFLEAMTALKVGRFCKYILYYSVRLFGKNRFRK